VFDTALVAGVTYTFTLSPDSGALDGDLFLLGSTSGQPATLVRNRASALAKSDTNGLGEAESFTFTPAVSDDYGLVLLNKAFGGTYTLSRSS
jgi:hypothetical protein